LFNWLEKTGAERGLQWSEIGLLVFAALVAIGLIGEYKKPQSERWKGLSDAFEMLVIIGVVGEVIFDGLIFGFSGRLTVIQDTAVEQATISASAATKNAGIANKAAGEANERAGKADERAGLANKAAGEAYKLAGEANERAGQAHERAGQLEVRAEEVRQENLKLQRQVVDLRTRQAEQEKKISVRDISDANQEIFTGSIAGNKRPITLILPDDQEARAYGDERVKPMLQGAGFVVKPEDLKGTSKYVGIIVCDNGAQEVKIFQALRKAKIQARLFSERKKDRPDFCNQPFAGAQTARVFVGQRPVPIVTRQRQK